MRKEATIFIVEDDEVIVQRLKNHLSQQYRVFSVSNLRSVTQEVDELQPDLILMDINLPYFNGFYWTTEIRKTKTMPIIFISSADDEMNAIMAMNMGGDDFIAKPFSLGLLDAKIAAMLRRSTYLMQTPKLVVDDFKLDLDGHFSRNGEHLKLTPTETKILAVLIAAKGEVVTKELLLDKLWEGEDFIDVNTLNVNMARLRKKVAQLGFDRIHTVRGVGYLVK